MSWTKRQYVDKAFSKAGLAGYVFDLTPEEYQDALSDLDSMMAAWNSKGIRLGWPMPSSPNGSDLDEETNIPDAANQTIYCSLAVLIAPGFGKTVPQSVAFFAKTGYDQLLSLAAKPMERQFPHTMPSGAGNKPWRTYDSPFLRPPQDPLLTGPDGPIEFD
jgi:hypothetical protein